MRVQAEEEGDEEVVRVPEGLEALLADAVVCRRVDEQHAEQHDVPRHAAGLLVVDIEGVPGADLRPLDVVEAVVSWLAPRNLADQEGHRFRDRGQDTYLT